MNEQRDWRKKQRAIVNSLREASLFRSELRVERAEGELAGVVTIDRVVDDEKGSPEQLVFHESPPDSRQRLWLIIEDVDEECVVPLRALSRTTWRIELEELNGSSWRPRSRWLLTSSQASCATYVTPADSRPAMVRVLGQERGQWLLSIQASAAPEPGDYALIHPGATGDHLTQFRFEVVKGRDNAALASRLPRAASIGEPSVVPHAPLELSVVIAELGVTAKLTTEQFTTDGFLAQLSDRRIAFPAVVGGKLSPQGIVCSLTVVHAERGLVEGRIGKCDRVAWYNWLTQVAFGFDTRLRPGDARAVTRLMLESRNYTEAALGSRVALTSAISAAYDLDAELSSTRFRWMARHSEGHLVGHLLGIQASPRIWAAIDNVGSQSHPGRWNASVVSRWIRVFGELVGGLPGAPLIQWSFSLKAGVWTQFYERVRHDTALVHAANPFVNIVLGNLPESMPSSNVDVTPITQPELLHTLERVDLPASVVRLLVAVCGDGDAGSAFDVAFEREYLKPFRRFYRRLRDENGASFVLTFSNHPTWPSLNQGHNFHYLVPLDAASPSKRLLDAIRHEVRANGCEPFRVMFLGTESEHGTPWMDLLLTPSAMSFAAEAAEAF